MCLYMVKLRVYPVCVWLPTASSRVVFYVSDFAFFYLSPFNVYIWLNSEFILFVFGFLLLPLVCFFTFLILRFLMSLPFTEKSVNTQG